MPKKSEIKKGGKAIGAATGVSGAGGVISAHNVCHAICLAVVSLLSVFGIIVSSDVLMWLQEYNMLFWGMGVSFLLVSLALLVRYKNCISKKLIIFNLGLIIIGIPFIGPFDFLAWFAGGAIALYAIYLYTRDMLKKRRWQNEGQK